MTHKEELIAGLQKLMKSDGIKRSKMGLVFEIYDTLVELRNSGVKAGDIEVLLNDPDGVFNFKLPKGSLTSYMHRIKLKKAASRVERRVSVAASLQKTKKPRKSKATVLLDGGKSVVSAATGTPEIPPVAEKILETEQDYLDKAKADRDKELAGLGFEVESDKNENPIFKLLYKGK